MGQGRLWAIAIGGILGACAHEPGPLGDPPELALRASADGLASPPEHRSGEPVPLDGRIPLIGFRFVEMAEPTDYFTVRLEAGDATLAARRSQVLDDIERAATRLYTAGLEAARIAEADRARVAVLASAWGAGRDMPLGSEILARVRANRWAVEKALSNGKAWTAAFRRACEQVRALEPDPDLGSRFNGALGRLDEALVRLTRVRDALAGAMDGLPRNPAQ